MPDVAQVVHAQFVAEGIGFRFEATLERVEGRSGDIACIVRHRDGREETVRGTHLLLATGRKLNVEQLGLDAAGVAVEDGRIRVDDRLRTSQPHIYVAGDVAGGPQFTHLAEHHAGIVLRHAIFRLRWARPSTVLPWCTYTDPEVARVGVSETEAVQRGIAHRVYRFPFEEIDRARAEGEVEGFAKLLTDPRARSSAQPSSGRMQASSSPRSRSPMSQGCRRSTCRRRSTRTRRSPRSAAASPTSA
jgi:pyruvate/2-oxoglutarate dehydrogenase complex dihydrolipoamide dehydrogenase (E3) component